MKVVVFSFLYEINGLPHTAGGYLPGREGV